MTAGSRHEAIRARHPSAQHGVIGGVEVLPFGFLVFVAGALLITNAWAVIDAKMAVNAAAREAGRAYVEGDDRAGAEASAAAAALRSMENAGRDPDRLRLADNAPTFVRCEVVVHEATYDVPTLTIPFIGGFGSGFTVRGSHREVIDPFAAGLGPEHSCVP